MYTGLTRVQDGLEGDIAALSIKGEFVNLHLAGADHHLVILKFHQLVMMYPQIWTWGGFVFLYPEKTHLCQFFSRQALSPWHSQIMFFFLCFIRVCYIFNYHTQVHLVKYHTYVKEGWDFIIISTWNVHQTILKEALSKLSWTENWN